MKLKCVLHVCDIIEVQSDIITMGQVYYLRVGITGTLVCGYPSLMHW